MRLGVCTGGVVGDRREEGSRQAAGRGASVAQSMAVTFVGNGVYLALGLATGVLSARLLQPEGRGEVGIVVAWSLTTQLIAGFGIKDSATFLLARRKLDARPVMTASLSMSVLFAVLGIVAAQLLVPVGMQSQSGAFQETARRFLLMIAPMLLTHTLWGVLAGQQRFVAAALLRVGQPFLLAVGLVALWATDSVTVERVLLAHALGWSLVCLITFAALVRDLGVAAPTRRASRELLSYGLRVHGQSLGTLANVRLDVMVMPAVLGAAEIGLYVVAVSAASVIMPLFAQLKTVLFPVAAGAGDARSQQLLASTLRITVLGSIAVAATVGVFAPFLVEFVYGADFAGAVAPLRLLLPGIVAWSSAAILGSALNASGRPGAASAAQFIGVPITVVGLFVTLPTLGIEGAALTTSFAYTVVCIVQVVMLRRSGGLDLRRTFSLQALLADVGHVRRQVSALRTRVTT